MLKRGYKRIDRLRVLTAVPLLAWLRTLPAARLPLADHERAVAAVESWVVRRIILGANTRGYNAAFMSVLKSAQAAETETEASIADAVVAALAAAPNSLEWPTDEQIETAFRTDRFYNRFTQERIRLILGAIDAQLQAENPKTESALFNYEELQIEHVMPQSWPKHWPLPEAVAADPAQKALAENERAAAVDRIGNLTLVTPTFNQNVSNLAWGVKAPELAAQSKPLNGPIGAYAGWDESAITGRAAALAAVACRVWPRSPVGPLQPTGFRPAAVT